MSDTAKFHSDLQAQRIFFNSGAPRSLSHRLGELKKLEEMIVAHTDDILDALYADLKKPRLEAFTSEVAFTLEELRLVQKELARWMRPQAVPTPLHLKPGRSEIHRDPLGVVLVLSPWNYPFQLAIAPLLAALAAGNCVTLKPSELAPHTSRLLGQLLGKTFAPVSVNVIEGGVAETTELLKLKFDHIFFTGSTSVGRVVMRAAAEHLTPVTLELGGKSPAIVTAHADLDLAARRIAWGKFVNAGQTCVAPDYVYVASDKLEAFTQKLRTQIAAFYGSDARASDSYARIVNRKNFDRLEKLLHESEVISGGVTDRDTLYIEPSILGNVSWESPVMRDEIFGPLLPLIAFDSLDQAFAEITTRAKPLSAYFFSQDSQETRRFLTEVTFGGGCTNDVLMHLANPHLPFGGVGASGMGSYHGEAGFLTFTHQKSVVRRSRWLDVSYRYPPYQAGHLKWIKKLFKMH